MMADTDTDVDRLLDAALSLDLSARAELAERLLASLDGLDEEEVNALWAAEAQRRLDAYRAGSLVAIDSTAVHEKAAHPSGIGC